MPKDVHSGTALVGQVNIRGLSSQQEQLKVRQESITSIEDAKEIIFALSKLSDKLMNLFTVGLPSVTVPVCKTINLN